ncbi:MAG: zinc-binding dehydrogenase [Phycisphaerales bacterium]|nr:zinc-binding dehydrogenase [Phycisphaerales bacterium]
MKALVVNKKGDPVAPNVTVTDLPTPEPGPGEVRIATEASALNHLDLWTARGLPGVETLWPHIGGSDCCGRVNAVGDGVDEAWVGCRVVLNAALELNDPPNPSSAPAGRNIWMIGEHGPGAHAEMLCAPATNVLAIPEHISAVDAAAYGLTHLTAWRMLHSRAQLRQGETVLITGIGGGVALACLNIAKWSGCRVIVTSRHQWKLDRATALGADEAVLDQGESWSRTVRSMTSKRGVDVCADSVGQAVHHSCIGSLARGGRFVTCGCTTGAAPQTDLARIFWNQLSVLGSTMGDMNEFRQSTALLTSGQITPVIDQAIPANDGAKAYARLEAGEQFGKIVLTWT